MTLILVSPSTKDPLGGAADSIRGHGDVPLHSCHRPRRFWAAGLAALVLAALPIRAENSIWLTQLDLNNLHLTGWAPLRIGRLKDAQPLGIGGRTFPRSLGTYATSTLWLELDGKVQRFHAVVGLDDSVHEAKAAVVFMIFGDDRKLWESGVRRRGDPPLPVNLDVTGIRSLLLEVDDVGKGTYNVFADWADARFVYAGTPPVTVWVPQEEAVILTPKPPPAPRINGPKVYGCRPGHPFLYRIPATGERPLRFSARGLPAGLQLDAATGIITGTAPARGTYAVTLRARNRHAENSRIFKIVSGDTLALTPPMGWNDWYG
ncbi:MAG: NPCBM/NEW2 domain-containing protein, partial [Opitutaceae bacterium]